MRFSYMFTDIPGFRGGGPMIVARRLLPEMKARGHEVSAVIKYHGESSPSSDYLRSKGIECAVSPWYPTTEENIRSVLQHVIALEPDVFVPNVHVSGCFAARWVRDAGIPTIAANVSNDDFSAGLVDQFVTGEPEWAVSGLMCVSNQLLQLVETSHPAETVLDVYPPGPPMPAGVADQTGPLRLVYAGRLEEKQKRVSDMFDALVRVMEAHPEVTVKIVGDGSKRSELEERTKRLGLDNRVTFTGFVDPEHVYDHLFDCQCMVLLSDYEGLPGAVIDGMACGLIPICLDVPSGLRELVISGETGFLVENRGDSFLSAINKIAHDESLRIRLSTAAREHVRQGFTIHVAASRWEQLSERLLANAGQRRRIEIPKRFELPPVHPGLAGEDRRHGPLWQRMSIYCRRRAGNAIFKLRKRWRTDPA